MFGTRAESVSRFLSKGSKVAIEGKLRWRQWETPQGDKRSKVEVVADDIEFISSARRRRGPTTLPPSRARPTSIEDDIPF